MASPDNTDWPTPTRDQFHMLSGLMHGEGLALVSAKDKRTGKFQVVVAVTGKDPKGGMYVWPVAVMMTDEEYHATHDYYEFPPQLKPDAAPEGSTIPVADAHDQTEALMDRIFPNRKKD